MFAVVFFSGSVARDAGEIGVGAHAWRNVSLVRYADEDLSSPSCSDWIIPGTLED